MGNSLQPPPPESLQLPVSIWAGSFARCEQVLLFSDLAECKICLCPARLSPCFVAFWLGMSCWLMARFLMPHPHARKAGFRIHKSGRSPFIVSSLNCCAWDLIYHWALLLHLLLSLNVGYFSVVPVFRQWLLVAISECMTDYSRKFPPLVLLFVGHSRTIQVQLLAISGWGLTWCSECWMSYLKWNRDYSIFWDFTSRDFDFPLILMRVNPLLRDSLPRVVI